MDSGERKYKNKDITVYWKPSSCIHASACTNGLPEVFDTGKRPWVNMDGSKTDKIIEVVDKCPVDALTWKWNDPDKNKAVGIEHPNHIKNRRKSLMKRDHIDLKRESTISIMDRGPLVINGAFILEKENGSRSRFSGTVSLCRCGASKLKPFCDGSHRSVNFET
ncbi:MAG: (4Fe-4S)-binding protein [Bacteroidales bacterium]|nr:(4Fe-4S)-binding protein [Bacteroidales bacterium]